MKDLIFGGTGNIGSRVTQRIGCSRSSRDRPSHSSGGQRRTPTPFNSGWGGRR
jgi:hypothetical protein